MKIAHFFSQKNAIFNRPVYTIMKFSSSKEEPMDLEQLSDAEKEQIEKDLRGAISTLIAGCEALDMEAAFGIFSDSPAFLMMGTDGSLCDYQAYVNSNIDYLMTCSSFKLTTFREEIRILAPDIAIFSWAYKAEATLKTGDQDVVENAGATFVFNKVNDAWKVAYYHESSVPTKRVAKAH